MRTVILALGLVLAAGPALAKQETFWVEKVAILAVGQGGCGMQPNDEAMQMSIGSAMITHAISKDAVIKRARKRAHRILADLEKHHSQRTFCEAFTYYLEKGYPR